jgi:nucleotide-binding universal stress UspA family protein
VATRSQTSLDFGAILCPVDFSEPSRLALKYAQTLARRVNAPLAALHVNDPLLVAAAAAALKDRDVVRRSEHELERFVREAVGRSAMRGLSVKTSATVGFSVDEILKAARRTRAGAIVMGTQGLTGAERLIMGSTTLGVLRRTRVPVLAVPPPLGGAADVPPRWPGERILASIELGRGARRDVATAARIAAWFGSALLLVHVVERVVAPGWLADGVNAEAQLRMAAAERRLENLSVLAAPHVAAATRVLWGRPAAELAALAAEERATLLVTALRGRQRWFRSTRGSLSYHVLSHAATPVFAYPPRWRSR